MRGGRYIMQAGRRAEAKKASKREREAVAASKGTSPMLSPFDTVPSQPPPLTPPPPSPVVADDPGRGATAAASSSYSPSLLIIAGILAFVIVASASIHLLLRFLSRARPSSQLLHHRRSSASTSSAAAVEAAVESVISDEGKKALIESLPLFSLASSLAALPKSSPDCAVCLSRFRPDDELRLLPACRHAFHSSCIDAWLRSTPSCPLCRASIALPHPPLPPPPAAADPARSGSFRIEIGSISSRRTPPEADAAGDGQLPPHVRSYSLGSSFEYLVEEEVEAVIARIRRRPPEDAGGAKEEKAEADRWGSGGDPPVVAPGEEVAEAAGERGRSWLREYVDRLASSASSSFSSLRFSGRWSHRFDDAGGGGGVAGGGGGGREFWDLEGSQQRELEESGFLALYRWLVGA